MDTTPILTKAILALILLKRDISLSTQHLVSLAEDKEIDTLLLELLAKIEGKVDLMDVSSNDNENKLTAVNPISSDPTELALEELEINSFENDQFVNNEFDSHQFETVPFEPEEIESPKLESIAFDFKPFEPTPLGLEKFEPTALGSAFLGAKPAKIEPSALESAALASIAFDFKPSAPVEFGPVEFEPAAFDSAPIEPIGLDPISTEPHHFDSSALELTSFGSKMLEPTALDSITFDSSPLDNYELKTTELEAIEAGSQEIDLSLFRPEQAELADVDAEPVEAAEAGAGEFEFSSYEPMEVDPQPFNSRAFDSTALFNEKSFEPTASQSVEPEPTAFDFSRFKYVESDIESDVAEFDSTTFDAGSDEPEEPEPTAFDFSHFKFSSSNTEEVDSAPFDVTSDKLEEPIPTAFDFSKFKYEEAHSDAFNSGSFATLEPEHTMFDSMTFEASELEELAAFSSQSFGTMEEESTAFDAISFESEEYQLSATEDEQLHESEAVESFAAEEVETVAFEEQTNTSELKNTLNLDSINKEPESEITAENSIFGDLIDFEAIEQEEKEKKEKSSKEKEAIEKAAKEKIVQEKAKEQEEKEQEEKEQEEKEQEVLKQAAKQKAIKQKEKEKELKELKEQKEVKQKAAKQKTAKPKEVEQEDSDSVSFDEDIRSFDTTIKPSGKTLDALLQQEIKLDCSEQLAKKITLLQDSLSFLLDEDLSVQKKEASSSKKESSSEKKDVPSQKKAVSSKDDKIVIPSPQPKKLTAKINIPNARVGTEFDAKIDITLDSGATAMIQSVIFPEDIGIVFDPVTSSLIGTPTKSGDLELKINWTCDDSLEHSSDILFIINPDPRSLWKIIEPPADAVYYKENSDHQLIIDGDIKIAAASRRGRSHEHVGSFRDDDFYVSHNSENGWSIMLVADGAGSAVNSREGSRIATQTVGNYLKKQLTHEKTQQLSTLVENWDDESQKEVGALFAKLFHNAAQLAVNKIANEAIEMAETVKSYSTTLLASVTFRVNNELFSASFWMGDGAIAAYGPSGKVRLLGKPDSGEYAGQTRFLDNDAINDTEFNNRIVIGKWADVSHLVLMTDGVSDPWFETDNGLASSTKWDALMAEVVPCLAEPALADKQLVDWLNFFSAGNHDDRTIIVLW